MRKKNLKVDLIAENVHIDFVVISLSLSGKTSIYKSSLQTTANNVRPFSI